MVFSPTTNSAVEFLVKGKYGRLKKKKAVVHYSSCSFFFRILLSLQS